jgi:predicted mannosyl-3-phosphoglycerate phosphatase (HAD superfamily)
LDIWDLEKELKTGTEQDLPLEEIGRRAIAIRNKNSERVKIKNSIAELLDCPIREFKRDHLSE